MSSAYRLSILTPTSGGRLVYHPDGLLEVDGSGVLLYAGKFRRTGLKTSDRRGQLAIPGLIDAHCHLSQYPAVASDGLELLPWLKCRIFPLERSFRGERVRAPARRFFKELAAHGTTCAAIHTSIWPDSTAICFEEAQRSGLRVIMGKVMMDRGSYDAGFGAAHPGEGRGAVSLNQSEALCRVWHGRGEGRLQYAFTPRFALSCSPRLMEGAARLASRYGAYLQTHLSENRREVSEVEEAFGRSYAEVYDRAGLIGRRTILAHCLWLKEAEYRILERRRPAVAHCPSSNAFLASGTMDMGRMIKGNIPLALGSDVAAGPSLDLFGEMRQAVFAQRAAHAADLFEGACAATVERVFSMATLGGSRALGLDERIGSLEAGKEADFVILDPADYEPEPGRPGSTARDVLSRLVYRAGRSSVRAAFVRGRRVFSGAAKLFGLALVLWAAAPAAAGAVESPVFSPPGQWHRWSNDGKYLVWTEGDKIVFAQTGTWRTVREIPGRAHYFALSRDGGLLAWWNPHSEAEIPVTVYDLNEGRELWTHRAPDAGAYHEFSPDGRHFGVGGPDKSYRAWEARSGRLVVDLPGAFAMGWGGADGHLFAYCTGKAGLNKGIVLDTKTGLESKLGRMLGTFCNVKFSPDGRWTAYTQSVEGEANGRVRVVELSSGRPVYEESFFYPSDPVFSEDSSVVVWTSRDEVHAVDLRAGGRHSSAKAALRGYFSDAWLELSAGGGVMAATTGTGQLAVLERGEGGLRVLHVLDIPKHYGDFSFSPDGLFYVYSAHEDPKVKLLDYRSGKWVHALTTGKNQFQSLQISPDGEYLLVRGTGGAEVWPLPQALGLKSRLAWREEAAAKLAVELQAEKEAKLREARAAKEAGGTGLVAPKGEFESSAEYESRLRAAEAKVRELDAVFQEKAKAVEAEYEGRLERRTRGLAPEADAFLRADKTAYPAVTLGRYDPETETFPAETAAGESISVTLPVPRAEAPRVKNAGIRAEAVYRSVLKDGALVRDFRRVKFMDPKLGVLASWTAPGAGEASPAPARRPDLPPALKAEVSFRDEGGDGVLDAGEKAAVSVRVSNAGPGPAFAVAVEIEPQAGAGLHYSALSRLGDLAAGQTRSIEITLRGGADAASGSRTLALKAVDANRFSAPPVRLTFKTREFLPPKLVLADFGIKDANGNGKVEPGELAELTVRLKNEGGSPARGAKLILSKSHPDLFIQGEPRRELGDLKPGESRDSSFTVFANTEYAGTALEFSAQISEREGRYGLSAPLAVPIGRLVSSLSEVVVAESGARGQAPGVSGLRVDVDEPIAPAAVPRPEALAVIFGIEKYRKAPAVTYARRDAAVFRDYAVGALGVPDSKEHIYYLDDDATLGEFKKAFSKRGWLARRAGPKSDVFIFIAGHGAPDLKNHDAYLIPEDGDPNYPAETGFPLQELKDLAASLKVRSVTIFLDACFSGSDRESRPLLAQARPLLNRVSPIGGALPPQVTLLAAAQEDQISSGYPAGRHGLFSYFLLKGLRGSADADRDRTITAGELGDFVREGVRKAAGGMDREQTPVLFGDPSRPVAVLPRP